MDWHGNLPQEKFEQIILRIPSVNDERFRLAVDVNFSLSITDHLNNTNLIGAMECLDDARKRYSQIQYSLYEAHTCVIWNREFTSQPCEENAILTGEYYLSYATLLMYAVAEDLSFFITYFLNIEKDIKVFYDSEEGKRKLEKANITSNAAKVGIFLSKKFKEHPLTNAIVKLHNNPDWIKALEYRNTWVHDKPPSIKGGGVEFTRDKKFTVDANGNEVTFLTAPQQKYSIDDLLDIGLKASEALAGTLAELAEIVINEKEALKNTFIQPNKDQL